MTSNGPLRIHVQESKNSIDVFRVKQEHLAPVIARVPGLAARISITYGNDREALDQALPEVEVLVVGNFDSENLQVRAPQLKWVQSIFAGVEKLLPHIPQATMLTNARGVHAPKAGEYALCALLMLNSQVLRFGEFQRRKQWEPLFTPVIAGKRVTILGTGNIGAAIARHTRHLGMRTTGVNRSGVKVSHFDDVFPASKLDEALKGADYLVSTLPNTIETKKLVDANALAALAPSAGVVSIGRGQVVDEAALIAALRSGHIGGAVLDVFETEPLPAKSPLWGMPNVMVSAHCGVDDLSAYLPRVIEIFVANLIRYLEGEPLKNQVNRELGY